MVSNFDMGLIASLGQQGKGGGGTQGKSLFGNKPAAQQEPSLKDPNEALDPNSVGNPLLTKVAPESGKPGSADLVDAPSGDVADGLTTQDKLSKIAKLFQGLA